MRREVSTRIAKDSIAKIIEDAKQGRRTVVLSRRVQIAVIGPVTELEDDTAAQIPTTIIKTGKQTIQGIKARNTGKAGVYLTVRDEKVASMLWLPSDHGEVADAEDAPITQRDEQVEELIGLLRETRAIQSQAEHYRKIREFVLGLIEHSETLIYYLPNDLQRDQLARKLEQLRADMSLPME